MDDTFQLDFIKSDIMISSRDILTIINKAMDILLGPTIYDDHKDQIQLYDAIKQAHDNGKLLILHVWDGDTPKFKSIELPERDFLVYNTKLTNTVFKFLQGFKVKGIPFCGCFYCPSDNPNSCICVREIPRGEEIALVFRDFFDFQEFLLETRYFNEQERELMERYNELERERLLAQEEEEEQAEETEDAELKNLEKRLADLPNEPDESDPKCVQIKCNINGKIKIRRFHNDDLAQDLYDFVAIDIYPSKPLIKYGLPLKEIDDYSKSFSELQFSKKEMIYVEEI